MIDWNKPIEYNFNGTWLPARVVCNDKKSCPPQFSYVVLYKRHDRAIDRYLEEIEIVSDEGKGYFGTQFVRNKKEKKEGWINLIADADRPPVPAWKIYKFKEEAIRGRNGAVDYMDDPVYIEWEQ